MKITTEITINQPADLVWSALAEDFTQIHQWFGAVKHAYELKGNAKPEEAPCAGRVCEFSDKPNGLKASEKITTYDKANYLLAFDVEILNAPFVFPVRRNTATFRLEPINAGTTRLVVSAHPELKKPAYVLYPFLKLGLTKNFSDLAKAFQAHCDNLQPASV